jgi:hypothetical protein
VSVLFDGDKALELATPIQEKLGDDYRVVLIIVPVGNFSASEVQISTPVDKETLLSVFRVLSFGLQESP